MNTFEKIIAKEEPATILFEDEYVISILDIDPVSEGHTLVIPKYTTADIEKLPHVYQVCLWDVAIKRVAELRSQYKNIVVKTNTGEGIMDVPHIHVHVYGVTA